MTCKNFSSGIKTSLALLVSSSPNFFKRSEFKVLNLVVVLYAELNLFLSLCLISNKKPFFSNSFCSLINISVFAINVFSSIEF